LTVLMRTVKGRAFRAFRASWAESRIAIWPATPEGDEHKLSTRSIRGIEFIPRSESPVEFDARPLHHCGTRTSSGTTPRILHAHAKGPRILPLGGFAEYERGIDHSWHLPIIPTTFPRQGRSRPYS
jgi:hypothetical protein